MPKYKHFRGPTTRITEPAELAYAKDKLKLLARSELFPVEFKQLQSGISLKRAAGIAYSPFIGFGGIIRCMGRIQHLAEIRFRN